LLSRSGAIALDDEAVTVDVALLETALAEGTTEGLERSQNCAKANFCQASIWTNRNSINGAL